MKLFLRLVDSSETWEFVDIIEQSEHVFLPMETPAVILRKIADRQLEIWTLRSDDGLVDAIILTRISAYGHFKTFDIVWAIGRGAELSVSRAMNDFEVIARDNGCGLIRIPRARKGWVKYLSPLGYSADRVVLEKELW